jgi:[ribosomal protein S5]-alanine N-acetyltransferase
MKKIDKLFPRSVASLDEALRLFEESQLPDARTIGKVIYYNQHYIDDVWIYGIDEKIKKMAMLSILIFHKRVWGQNIETEVISKFSALCFGKYEIEKLGAFTLSSNARSVRALEKAGFKNIEKIAEHDAESCYLELSK